MKVEFRSLPKGRRAFARVTTREFRLLANERAGLCVACGRVTYGGVESLAHGHECAACGEREVRGVDTCLETQHVVVDETAEQGPDAIVVGSNPEVDHEHVR